MSELTGLTRGQVHLWYTQTEDAKRQQWLTRYDGLLSSDERARHHRFVFKKDRDQFLIARVLLRTTLSRYSSEQPERWRFRMNEFGKPEIDSGQSHSQLRFNLSHCDGFVLCGVTVGCDIGVDCENVSRQAEIDKLAARVFSARELKFFGRVPAPMRTEMFFRIWTLKEAYVKARGLGMSLPLQKFSFDFADTHRIRSFFDSEVQNRSQEWQFVQPDIPEPFIAALAVNLPEQEKLSIQVRQV